MSLTTVYCLLSRKRGRKEEREEERERGEEISTLQSIVEQDPVFSHNRGRENVQDKNPTLLGRARTRKIDQILREKAIKS